MSGIGGSIESVSLFGRNFAVAADADSDRDIGGKSSSIEPNGDGTARIILTAKNWKIGGLSISIDDAAGDHEFLQGVAESKNNGPVTITYASGIVYQGVGRIIDDLNVSSQSSKADITLSGPGKLTKQ